MIELRHMDVRHFVITECRHLTNGCTIKCGCIALMLFCYLSCLGAITLLWDLFRYMRAESVTFWWQVVLNRRPVNQNGRPMLINVHVT